MDHCENRHHRKLRDTILLTLQISEEEIRRKQRLRTDEEEEEVKRKTQI
jgi:hypothetical protein